MTNDLVAASALRGSSFCLLPSSLLCGVVLFTQFLWMGPSHSADSAMDKEATRQEEVYRSRGENVPAGYVVDRSLLAYAAGLPAGFDRSLAELGPTDRWLDIGAGEGKAILDYYTPRYDAMHPQRRGPKGRAVAISIEDRRTARWHETAKSLEANQITYWSGRRLREYSSEELGRFQLVTDLTGGFSYTRTLTLFMERVLGALDLDGVFYTLLLDVLPEGAAGPSAYPDSLFLTEIRRPDGTSMRVCSWLKSISCVEVTCEPDTKSKRPVELYRVRKTCNAVSVPHLELVGYGAGTPPLRRFQLGRPPWEVDQ
jgi:hypothetical protein